MRPHDLAQYVRFSATRGARTGAAKQFERKKRLDAVTPGNGHFLTDEM
jgi:hypothetical protein